MLHCPRIECVAGAQLAECKGCAPHMRIGEQRGTQWLAAQLAEIAPFASQTASRQNAMGEDRLFSVTEQRHFAQQGPLMWS